MDSSLPLGPGITPSFQVPDPQDLRLRLWVNGELQQDESTSDMVCPVAELVSAASEVVTLEPGDVIATGTPSGVGAGRGLYLRAGDVVRAFSASSSAVAAVATVQSVTLLLPPSHVPAAPAARCR
jgi:2-keto-4-pentenoate hydratase/2-oxohepta-3-ene-1,7-dioic acid hydratase in catechol pathway